MVDEATWPFRGDLWAHLVSDESFDELHQFAQRLGLRRPGGGQPWTRVLEIGAGVRFDHDARARIDTVLTSHLGAERRRSVGEALARAAPDDPRLVGWGAWCLMRPGELAIAADLYPADALPSAEIDAILTQSGVFDAVYCWSRDGALTIEMMVRLS